MALLGLVGMPVLLTEPVHAQTGIPVFGVTQSDLDGDGRPDLTVVDCAFASARDRILIVDRAGNMGIGSDVRTIADFRDDVWIFDVGADGTAQLVLAFAREGEYRWADLYDDRNGDGQVSYRTRPRFVEVTESSHWHIRAIARSDWFLPDGRVNPALVFQIDGYILRYLEWGEAASAPDWARKGATTDGGVDWEIEVVDANGDGIADYQLQRLLALSPPDANIFRSTLYVNQNPRPPDPYEDALFWPLLVGKHNYEAYHYFDRPPVIAVDWDRAQIDRVGILGYPTEQGYHINSWAPWRKGKVNYANFENPMAYYDLAQDADGRPELMVRFEVFAAGDSAFSQEVARLGGLTRPFVQADYSWDQNNDGRWDYEISMAGFHPVTDVVAFPDFAVQTVPYPAIPAWVMGRDWAVATLVVAESGGYWSSEGMGDWDVNRGFRDGQLVEPSGLRDLYLMGLIEEPPLENYADIRRGMRGEYATEWVGRPTLYWSPVDGRLHLFRAQGGVWNVDGRAVVRYADRDRDGYLDQWEYADADGRRRQLNRLPGFLLYAGDGEVIVKRVDVAPFSFSVSPPRNFADWQALQQRLASLPAPASADDLRGMLARPEGPETRLTGAAIQDLQVTRRGFRFILRIGPGAQVTSGGVEGFAPPSSPGAYRVVWEDGRWSVRPLTPAALGLVVLEVEATREGEDATVRALLRNFGLEDARQIPLCVQMEGPRGARQVLTATLSSLPGEEEREILWGWRPSTAGVWNVSVMARCDGEEGGPVLLGATRVSVARQPSLFVYPFLALTPRVRAIVVGLLAGIVLLAGGLIVLWNLERGVWLSRPPTGWYLFFLAGYVLLAAGYIGARFLWNWTSTDDARLTVAAEAVYAEGTFLPSETYPFGYGYPALNAFLSHLTGLSIRTLQVYVQPFLVVLLVPLAFAAYRNLTGRPATAMLAALMLFLQPEFLFESARSSHAKLTWAMALGLLYALAASFRAAESGRPIARWVVLGYLFAFGLTTSSAFFASSYLFAIACSFLGWHLWRRWGRRRVGRWTPLTRLLYVTLSCSALLYVVIYHVYPPAAGQLSILRSVVDQVAMLFLGVEIVTNPYRYVQAAWVSEGVYIALTLFNWIVLFTSFGFWLLRAKRMTERREEPSPHQLFLWLLYGGFGLFLAISVVLDLSGTLSANMQVRVFPHLMVVAIPLAAEAVVGLVHRLSGRPLAARRLLFGGIVVLMMAFSLASLLKVTNEPLLSHNWVFHTDLERRAVEWLGTHRENARVWMGVDERLVALAEADRLWRAHRLQAEWGRPDDRITHFVFSEIMTLRAWRTGTELPDVFLCNRIYDNRFTAIYRTRSGGLYRR